ncbi:hypothetical protein HK104_000385 [Borealophlyctis nickersoniae]|nr:hypothetical protein HK104_000385 [Borealophlyctis nickersoniae]
MASRLLSRSLARVATRRAAILPSMAPRVLASAAQSHTLVVPYAHLGITNFENGIPVDQVRTLGDHEKDWDFWTTSDAPSGVVPTLEPFNWVPHGKIWIVKSGGSYKACGEGFHFLIPGLHKIVAVKNTYPTATGVISPNITTKDGKTVDGYAVFYYKVTDPVASAAYISPDSGKADSERAAAKLVRATLAREVANGTEDKAALAQKIRSALEAKSEELFVELVEVDVRGLFPKEVDLANKLRALDPPLPAPGTPGHNLAADYWADVLTPPFFEKRMFGSHKEVRTPATVGLEWSIPSPPDYHPFNELPRVIGLRPGTKTEESKH